MMSKARRLTFVVVTVGVAGLAFVASSAPPVVTWSPGRSDMTVATGGTHTLSISGTSTRPLEAVRAEVTPALRPYITVTPQVVSSAAGSSFQITIMVAVSENTDPGVVEGTLHLRDRSATVSRPFPIRLSIWRALTTPAAGVAVGYPPEWRFNSAVADLGGPVALRSFAEYSRGGVRPFGGAEIDITRTHDGESLEDVIEHDFSDTEPVSATNVAVAARAGRRLTYVDATNTAAEVTTVVYVPHGGWIYKFFLTYSEGDPAASDHIATFEKVLSTARFSE